MVSEWFTSAHQFHEIHSIMARKAWNQMLAASHPRVHRLNQQEGTLPVTYYLTSRPHFLKVPKKCPSWDPSNQTLSQGKVFTRKSWYCLILFLQILIRYFISYGLLMFVGVCLHVCKWTCQKWILDPVNLELQMVVGAGNWAWIQQVTSNYRAISPPPFILLLFP